MIDIAISPCPNDTFLFDGWLNGKIDSSLTPQVTFADIQSLNILAKNGSHSLIKVSTFCFGKISNQYELLPVGAAIGSFGPKIIAKKNHRSPQTIAVPGCDTTAHLLFQTLYPTPLKVIYCRYNEIPTLLNNGAADLGLIIHETRFTFEELGFIEIADLGELFYKQFGLPVPLGVLCIKRTIPQNVKNEVILNLRASLTCAREAPQETLNFVLTHSIEKKVDVVLEHIAAYVNEESYQISTQGIAAIKMLFTLAVEKRLLPKECVQFNENICICNTC